MSEKIFFSFLPRKVITEVFDSIPVKFEWKFFSKIKKVSYNHIDTKHLKSYYSTNCKYS